MKKRMDHIIRSVIFLILTGLTLGTLDRILVPKFDYSNSDWPTTSTYEQFYRMNRDSVDVLFLGSSVMVNAASPQQIYRQYGIRSYNLASENQSPIISYWWLKEALRFQHPAAAVMDCRFLFPLHKENDLNMIEGLVRKSIDPMRWSTVKMAAVHDICSIDIGQDELSYYLTNLRYHERWKVLTRDDFDASMRAAPLKGYAPIYGYGPEEYETYDPSGSGDISPFDEHMGVYLDQITRLCRENGISLILIDLPGNNMNDGVANALAAYAEQNGIRYLNYCETRLYGSLGASLPEENVTAHANVAGSVRFSDAVGRFLQEECGVPAVTDGQYEKDMASWDHILNNDILLKTDDAAEYLELLGDEDYTVFFSVYEDAGEPMAAEVLAGWKALGLSVDLSGMYERSYSAVISGRVLYEESGTGFLSNTLMFNDKRASAVVESAGRNSGSWSSVRIDGKEYSPAMPGINIVVYDNVTGKVLDRVNYDPLKRVMTRPE